MVTEVFKDENEKEYTIEIRQLTYGDKCELDDRMIELEMKPNDKTFNPLLAKINTAGLRTWLPVYSIEDSTYPFVLKATKKIVLEDGSAISKEVEIGWKDATLEEKHKIICKLSPLIGERIARLCRNQNTEEKLFRSGV